jgi:hypothetical protein
MADRRLLSARRRSGVESREVGVDDPSSSSASAAVEAAADVQLSLALLVRCSSDLSVADRLCNA